MNWRTNAPASDGACDECLQEPRPQRPLQPEGERRSSGNGSPPRAVTPAPRFVNLLADRRDERGRHRGERRDHRAARAPSAARAGPQARVTRAPRRRRRARLQQPPHHHLGVKLLVADCRLPGADGIALADVLVAASPELAVLVISGYLEDEASARLATWGYGFFGEAVLADRAHRALPRGPRHGRQTRAIALTIPARRWSIVVSSNPRSE